MRAPHLDTSPGRSVPGQGDRGGPRRRSLPRATGLLPALLLAKTLTGCSGDSTLPTPAALELIPVVDGLESPLYLTATPGDDRLFIVEQPGRIRIVKGGALLPEPFLDIVARVGSGGERGLLGLAFHPQYSSNGLFYVDYTDRSGDTRVERYRVTEDPDVADPASARLVLVVDQPFSNHNGGMALFGPDGKLYVGLGDGGSGGDPQEHGQNKATLLGSLLRLDVDAGDPYAVPPDNPFVGDAGARPEIWAWGLRNPWRFAFDGPTGQLYVADVGQNQWEEVNVVPAASGGLNFGWNLMEGEHCFSQSPCQDASLVRPVLEYDHAEGCSVTGGFVYRGEALPSLVGHYFYSDYCGGWIRSFRLVDGEASEQRDWELDAGRVLSFGEDADGELYVMNQDGEVFRLGEG